MLRLWGIVRALAEYLTVGDACGLWVIKAHTVFTRKPGLWAIKGVLALVGAFVWQCQPGSPQSSQTGSPDCLCRRPQPTADLALRQRGHPLGCWPRARTQAPLWVM